MKSENSFLFFCFCSMEDQWGSCICRVLIGFLALLERARKRQRERDLRNTRRKGMCICESESMNKCLYRRGGCCGMLDLPILKTWDKIVPSEPCGWWKWNAIFFWHWLGFCIDRPWILGVIIAPSIIYIPFLSLEVWKWFCKLNLFIYFLNRWLVN